MNIVEKRIKIVSLPIFLLNQPKKIYQTYKDCLLCFIFYTNLKTVKNLNRKSFSKYIICFRIKYIGVK